MSSPALRVLTVVLAVTFALPVTAQRLCTGDCGGDASVTVDEIVTGTNIALGEEDLDQCAAFDRDGGESIQVDELITGITYALDGCPLTTVADAAFWQTLQGVRDRQAETIALYEQTIGTNPTDSRSHFLLAMMHF